MTAKFLYDNDYISLFLHRPYVLSPYTVSRYASKGR